MRGFLAAMVDKFVFFLRARRGAERGARSGRRGKEFQEKKEIPSGPWPLSRARARRRRGLERRRERERKRNGQQTPKRKRLSLPLAVSYSFFLIFLSLRSPLTSHGPRAEEKETSHRPRPLTATTKGSRDRRLVSGFLVCVSFS